MTYTVQIKMFSCNENKGQKLLLRATEIDDIIATILHVIYVERNVPRKSV